MLGGVNVLARSFVSLFVSCQVATGPGQYYVHNEIFRLVY